MTQADGYTPPTTSDNIPPGGLGYSTTYTIFDLQSNQILHITEYSTEGKDQPWIAQNGLYSNL